MEVSYLVCSTKIWCLFLRWPSKLLVLPWWFFTTYLQCLHLDLSKVLLYKKCLQAKLFRFGSWLTSSKPGPKWSWSYRYACNRSDQKIRLCFLARKCFIKAEVLLPLACTIILSQCLHLTYSFLVELCKKCFQTSLRRLWLISWNSSSNSSETVKTSTKQLSSCNF